MDWDSIIVAAIVSLPPTLLGIATLIQGLRTHATFNSKMDAMLKLTQTAAFAAGQKDERSKTDSSERERR